VATIFTQAQSYADMQTYELIDAKNGPNGFNSVALGMLQVATKEDH
jgi:hypothetical protein